MNKLKLLISIAASSIVLFGVYQVGVVARNLLNTPDDLAALKAFLLLLFTCWLGYEIISGIFKWGILPSFPMKGDTTHDHDIEESDH